LPTLLQTIGENVRKRRRVLGLTQEKLAERAGIGRHFLSDIETGRRHISVPTLIRLAAALNMSADVLLGIRERAQSGAGSDLDALLLRPLWEELREIPPEYGMVVLRMARKLARDFRPLTKESVGRRTRRKRNSR
jgi:transcriptional regulator with XRE-family HTH domain